MRAETIIYVPTKVACAFYEYYYADKQRGRGIRKKTKQYWEDLYQLNLQRYREAFHSTFDIKALEGVDWHFTWLNGKLSWDELYAFNEKTPKTESMFNVMEKHPVVLVIENVELPEELIK